MADSKIKVTYYHTELESKVNGSSLFSRLGINVTVNLPGLVNARCTIVKKALYYNRAI